MVKSLSDHEPAKPGPEYAEQSPQDTSIVKEVERMFIAAKKARDPYTKDFLDNYKFIRGKQWADRRPSYRHSEVVNLCHSVIQASIPILTDSRPIIETAPQDPSDFDFSEVLNEILISKWDRDLFSNIVSDVIWDAMVYGTGIAEVPYNPEADHGIGDYDFCSVDPLYVFPDPRMRNFNDNFGKYVILAVPTELKELKRRYPDKGHMLKADIARLDMGRPQLKRDDWKGDGFKPTGYSDNFSLIMEPASDQEAGHILLLTRWMHSDEVEEQTKVGPDGKETTKTIKKFPRGRKTICAGGVLLEDIENPYMDSKMPFGRLQDYIAPREFWGQAELEQLKGPQLILNRVSSYILDIIILMGNPVWKNPVNSMVNPENLINIPGMVISHAPEAAPVREQGVPPPPVLLSFMNLVSELFDKISGVNEVSRGMSPQNVSSLSVERLQEAAQTRLRLKGRLLENFLTQIGQLMVSRILQFYTAPRIIRLTNDEGAMRFFKFFIEENVDEAGALVGRRAVHTPYGINADGYVERPPVAYEIKGNLDVKITTGSSLPFKRAARANSAWRLFDIGVFDAEDLLDAIEWPKKHKILKKYAVRKEQAEMARAQELQMGMKKTQTKGV